MKILICIIFSIGINFFMDQPEIDGALVGGASLDPDKFMAIIDF